MLAIQKAAYQREIDRYAQQMQEFETLAYQATTAAPPEAPATYFDALYDQLIWKNQELLQTFVELDRKRRDDPEFNAYVENWLAQSMNRQNTHHAPLH